MLGFIFHTWSIWVRLCTYPMSNSLLSQNGIEDSANRSLLNPPWVSQRNVRRMRRKPKFMTSGRFVDEVAWSNTTNIYGSDVSHIWVRKYLGFCGLKMIISSISHILHGIFSFKTGWWIVANVGIHIPALWVAYGYSMLQLYLYLYRIGFQN